MMSDEQNPVAWLFQNEETGLTECVDVQQVEWGFEKNNPRWQKIAPLYTHPPVTSDMRESQIESAAKKLAEVMEYPWDYMPEQGKTTMRKNAVAVIEAALAKFK